MEDKLMIHLLESVSNGELSYLEKNSYLFSHFYDIHRGNDILLRKAAEKGHVEIFEFLLERGANLRALNDYCLIISSWFSTGSIEIMKMCLENGADVNSQNGSALNKAVIYKHVDKVRLLLLYGADTNLLEDYNLSCVLRSVDMMSLLSEYGVKADGVESPHS